MLPGKLKAFEGEQHQPFKHIGAKSGHAVLLVHGFPGTPAELRPVAAALHEAGWTTQGVLLPGFGAEVETLPERTLAEWLAAIQKALSALQSEYDTVLLYGHSMGGALSMQVAVTSPQKPHGLILSAPFWKLDHLLWTAMPVLKVFFPKPKIFKLLNLDFKDPETRAGIHNFMPDADLDDPQVQAAIRNYPIPVKMFAQIYQAGHMAYELAPKITMPTLVLQGAADELVTAIRTQQMIKRIPAKVTYVEVQAQHDLWNHHLADWPRLQGEILGFARTFERELT